MLAKAVWPTPATAQDSWSSKRPPGSCYRCGQQSHWARAWPNPHKPRGPCPGCCQERHWAVDCPHITQDRWTSFWSNSPADVLGLAMDDWRDPHSLDPTTAITSRERWVGFMVCGRPISFLLNTGVTYSVATEFGGPTSPSHFSTIGIGGQPYLPHQTPPLSCIFRGIPFTHTFLVVLTCPVPLLGRGLLAKLGASPSFAPPISLNPSLPAARLILLLASQPTNHLVSLNSFSGTPLIWDIQNLSVAKHHSPVIIQLLDSTRYVTQAQ